MKRCNSCNRRIAFGGQQVADEIYCNNKCQEKGLLAAASRYLNADVVQARLQELQSAPCPKCGGEGPNDMQSHHNIWSVVVLTKWEDIPEICCKKCGTKKKLRGIVCSGLLGWWGFPFGIIMTPIQLFKNISGLFKSPMEGHFSKEFAKAVRIELGAGALFTKQQIETERADSSRKNQVAPPPLSQPTAG